jgi:hypothetical protein
MINCDRCGKELDREPNNSFDDLVELGLLSPGELCIECAQYSEREWAEIRKGSNDQ